MHGDQVFCDPAPSKKRQKIKYLLAGFRVTRVCPDPANAENRVGLGVWYYGAHFASSAAVLGVEGSNRSFSNPCVGVGLVVEVGVVAKLRNPNPKNFDVTPKVLT